MIAETYNLDMDRLFDESPDERDGNSTSLLPMFSIPFQISVHFRTDQNSAYINSIEFKYDVKEEDDGSAVLDELENPIITVSVSKYTNKVTSLSFDQPITRGELSRVAARLRAKANNRQSTPSIGRRLGYRLIAEILDDWRLKSASKRNV